MMYFLTVANFIVFAVAAWVNYRRIVPDNPRRMLRVSMTFVCTGTAVLYLLGVIGVISSEQIPFVARAVMLTLGMVAIVEGKNG